MPVREVLSATALRRRILACQAARLDSVAHEHTYGSLPSVLYAADEDGGHGNFLAASYKRICADPDWRQRLEKTYTSSARVVRSGDRWRGELECANSSDALLMNIFCYPRVLHRPGLCRLLGLDPADRPRFGVRANLLMKRGEVDRTELDMVVGDLAVEAKLTESSFGTASRDRATRYLALEEIFDVDELPWQPRGLGGYQLVRGVMAAHAEGKRFLLLCDGRRADLQETWFQVLRAVRSYDVRSRMVLLSWQELATELPDTLQHFLQGKYDIHPA